MKLNFDNRKFQSLANTENGEVNSDTIFEYYQQDDMIWADYSGGQVVKGHLIGKMLESGDLEFIYHHVNTAGDVMAGKCRSIPSLLPDGRIKVTETWQWLTGDKSSGESELIEIVD